MPKDSRRNIVIVDPEMVMERLLKYREKHQGWSIFFAIYWSIYLFVIGLLLLYYSQIGFTVPVFFGSAIIIFAVMLILYGMTQALHHKFMRRYG